MHNRLTIGAAALLLASATFASAQQSTSSSGTLDLGGRFTSTDGDEARYERYRDLRDGANINLLYKKQTEDWNFDVKALNAGYRDQRYLLNFNSSRVKLSLSFDQTPTNYAYYTKTPFACTAGNCSLDAGLRAQVEAGRAVGIPMNVGQLAGGSIYNTIARQFDLQSRRDTFAGEARISATDNLDFTLGFDTYKRTGNMPWGAGFAFSVLSELPLEIDNRETDVSVGAEWASHQGMFRVNYQHSKFDQAIPTLTFDNPIRATDYCQFGISGQAPGTCYHPSGYSNGLGPNDGLMAMAPSNTLSTFSWMGMVKLPARTTANATFSAGTNRQDEALIGWTTNPVIANPAVYATFPALAELPRDTANMHVNYTTATMSLSSRPHKYVSLNARYRYNGRSDFTHPFDAVEYVRFDAVPEETGGETEPFSVDRNSFDANVSFTPIPRTAIRVGYGYYKLEHGVRTTEGYQDDTFRVSFDTVGNQYFTLRAMYEMTEREAIDLSAEALAHAAMQPAARFYDEASRNRDRVTFAAEITPTSSLGFNASYSMGKDDYQEADPQQQFGLLNNENTAYSVGVSYAPSAKVNFGADYGYEKFEALQQSRNANPAPDPSWTDPNRNWTLFNDETVNNFSVYLNLVKAFEKTDIRASYDYSDSDQGFQHGGPRIASLSVPTAAAPAGTFVALPNVTNSWHRATIDFRYNVSEKLGFGAAWWYEKFDVEDYATINTAGPQTLPRAELGAQTDVARIDWLGSLLTGYGNRPYTGNTVFVRMFYMF
ncbi:MAG: MtrB/PioB family outer membrane beta-barrel protein [Vicinamibacteria bacterium]